MPFRIERLTLAHDRLGFVCGTPALDRYFRELVTQDVKRRLSNCFVAVEESNAIAGYYTLAATGVPMGELPAELTGKLPRYELLPAVLIGRLAVDTRFQGRRLGSVMVIDAVARASRADPAVYALIVDAKDDTAVAFYEHLGFIRFAGRPKSLLLPMATALKVLGGDT